MSEARGMSPKLQDGRAMCASWQAPQALPCVATDERVDSHGNKDDEAIDALQPQWIDPRQCKAILNYQEQHRAERHSENAARATADGDATNNDRRNHCQLETGRDTRIDSRIARRPECPVQAGEEAGDDEGREHQHRPADANLDRSLRIRADCVEIAPDREQPEG